MSSPSLVVKSLARLSVVGSLVMAALAVAPTPFGGGVTPVGHPSSAEATNAVAGLPLSFERNAGQASEDVQFLARNDGSTLYLADERAVLSLGGPAGALVGMEIVGPGRLVAPPQGRDPQPGRVNYLDGLEGDWITDVPTFGSVRYEGIFRGIDVIYHGRTGQLEYDFVVAPGADPSAIALSFSGIDGMTIAANGDLLLESAAGQIAHKAPVVYQETASGRRLVPSAYRVDGGLVSFTVGAYDRSRELVIDPVLTYSTYLGGRSNDTAYAVAVDGAGNAYIGGRTGSADFPLRNPYETRLSEGFVTKLNPAGTALVYSTYFPGIVEAITVDAGGNAYVTGPAGLQFAATAGAFQTTQQGGFDAFITKINPQGSGLVLSTYVGGDWDDFSTGIAVDGAGNTYLTGWTKCPIPDGTVCGFPTKNAFQPRFGGGNNDAFVTKMNPTGTDIVYSTFLGGGTVLNTTDDWGQDIAVDATGAATVMGYTFSQDFPVTAGDGPTTVRVTAWICS